MNRITIISISLILLITIFTIIPVSMSDSTTPSSNSNTAFTAATFADKYKYMSFTGKKVTVVIKLKGQSESNDQTKSAKEIRYFQTYVLKFLSFANAVNVVSDQQKNEITAQIDSAWIPVLEMRGDVISVTVVDFHKTKNEFAKLSPKKQQSQGRSINEFQCMKNFILILKYDNSPCCVKPLTSEKLIERG